MVDWGPRDYQPIGWEDVEDLTEEDEEEVINLEMIINLHLDQYRPQEFIVDDFSWDAVIPPMDNYEDQLEQMKQEELGKMVQERLP